MVPKCFPVRRPALRGTFAVAMAAAIALGLAAQERLPGLLGFPTTLDEILTLEELNYSARYDDQAAMEATWGGAYDHIWAIELPAVQNRYALFVSDARRQVDVAIRGTVNLKNAAFDIEFLKDRSPLLGIHLHKGFERVATAVYEDLKLRLPPGYRIRITGHSLGAAEAIILGMYLSHDGLPVDLILASAPPKVTDGEGWQAYAGLPVVRLAGAYDPVPFMPPRSLLYGRDPYTQGGPLLFLLDGRKATVMQASFYDDLPDAFKQVVSEGRHFDVADHLLRTYLGRLLPKKDGVEAVDPLDWEAWALPAER